VCREGSSTRRLSDRQLHLAVVSNWGSQRSEDEPTNGLRDGLERLATYRLWVRCCPFWRGELTGGARTLEQLIAAVAVRRAGCSLALFQTSALADSSEGADEAPWLSQGVRLTDDRSRQGRLRTASKLDLYASNSASNSYTYCASWERWPHSVTGQRRCAHLSAWKLSADAGHTEAWLL
jgi:hypothetical protein